MLAADTGRVWLGLGVALLCLMLLSVGIAWRPGGLPVTIDATAKASTVHLVTDWTAPARSPALAVSGIELTGELGLASAGLALPADAFGLIVTPLAQAQQRLRVRVDRLSAGTALGLDLAGVGPLLMVGGGNLHGRIEAQGVRLEVAAGQGARNEDLARAQPEVLRFALGGHPDNPGELGVATDRPLKLDGLVVDNPGCADPLCDCAGRGKARRGQIDTLHPH